MDPNSASSLYRLTSLGSSSFSSSLRKVKSLVECLPYNLRILCSFTLLLRNFCKMPSALFLTKKSVNPCEYSTNPIYFLREYSFNLFTNFYFSWELRKDMLLIFFSSA